MKPVYFINVFGWVGSVAVIIAYALISLNKVNSRSGIYQWLNLAGSLCLVVNTAYYHAYPSTFVNLIWMVIAATALVRIFRSLDLDRSETS
jgi:hypothetical protein